MAEKLKSKVVSGFAWNVAEKVASALFQAWVTVNVLNRLVPNDTALIGILAAFVAVFNTVVDSGFSQALIRKKAATTQDFSSAFWFNMAMSAVVYGVLVGLSYPAAQIFKMPDLTGFAPVFFLIVPFGALGIVQQTVLTREFDFRRLSTITFAATIASGLIAVGLAFAGAGVWALVGQRLSQTVVRVILLWIFGRWHPEARFSSTSIREMYGYSSRLLGTDLLVNLYTNVPQFVIGGMGRATLGVYETARKVRDLPVNSTMSSMQSVTFPALASISDDDGKFARSVGRVLGSMVFLIFPMMAGLIVVADELFGVFLKPEWSGSVPFFRILCLGGMASPIFIISGNILRTRSDGKAVLRAEIVKKIVATAILACTIPFGAMAVVWGIAGIALSDAAVSFWFARRWSAYGFRSFARDVLPTLGLTAAMAAVVWFVGGMLGGGIDLGLVNLPGAGWPQWAVLTVKIVIGAAFYACGAAVLRLEAMREFLEVVRRIVGKIR